jgi:hypothetical protein
MLWLVLVNQAVMIAITSAATVFAYKADQNSRWLQEVMAPWMAHISSIIDPNWPKPPDPPPITE